MKVSENLHLWRQTSWVVISSPVPGVLGGNSCLYLSEYHSVQLPLASRSSVPQGYTALSWVFPALWKTPSSQGLTSPVECLSLVDDVYTCTPTAEPPFQQSTLIKLCCAQGNLLFKIQWKWGHWKLIIMLTALWAFACDWNDFTKRNSNEGWIGREDKLFPSHFPNDRPTAM